MKSPMLTKNFTSSELACPCCNQCVVTGRLITALQSLRDSVQRPITVSSGYRCRILNEQVGGSSQSQHLQGTAADIHIKGMSIRQMYDAALKIPEFAQGGIGVYPKELFIHVDVRQTKKPARWARINGKYVGIDEGLQEVTRMKENKEKS